MWKTNIAPTLLKLFSTNRHRLLESIQTKNSNHVIYQIIIKHSVEEATRCTMIHTVLLIFIIKVGTVTQILQPSSTFIVNAKLNAHRHTACQY